MGRMEEKRVLKRKKRYVNICLMILFILLILGVVATDYAIRDMMALFDGGQLLAYWRDANRHYIEIFGSEYYFDEALVYESLKGYIEWTRLKSGELIKWLKGLL